MRLVKCYISSTLLSASETWEINVEVERRNKITGDIIYFIHD